MTGKLVLKATHEGKIKLGATEIYVAVLNVGTRVISTNAIYRAFSGTESDLGTNQLRTVNMPSFLDAKNLQSFIGEELKKLLRQLDFEHRDGKTDRAYNALILPMLCKVYLDARSARNPETGRSILTKQQQNLAKTSEQLLLGLSGIGITALIDEATGYQYERERNELQNILSAFIAQELMPWQKKFPDELYKEIFRLNGWNYTVHEIKQRSRAIGRWTNNLIYQQLPQEILKELYAKAPKTSSRNMAVRLRESLATEIGNLHLEKQLISVIILMNVSTDWRGFLRLFNKKFGQEIEFSNIEELGIPKISFGKAISNIVQAGKPS